MSLARCSRKAPSLKYFGIPFIIGSWILLSHLWIESSCRLADYVAYPQLCCMSCCKGGDRKQNTTQQNKKQKHMQDPAAFHSWMLCEPRVSALVIWIVEPSLHSGPQSSEETDPPIVQSSLFILSLPELEAGSAPITTWSFLQVSRCFHSFFDISLLSWISVGNSDVYFPL